MTRHFQQAKSGNFTDLNPRPVNLQRITHSVFNSSLVFLRHHIDEVDDHESADISQTQLATNFFCCLKVCIHRRLFNIATPGSPGRVDVDRDKCFCRVNDNRATRRQSNLPLKCGFYLALYLVPVEQGNCIFISFDATLELGHDLFHELDRLVECIIRINENFTNVFTQIVTNGPDYYIAFLVDQKW